MAWLTLWARLQRLVRMCELLLLLLLLSLLSVCVCVCVCTWMCTSLSRVQFKFRALSIRWYYKSVFEHFLYMWYVSFGLQVFLGAAALLSNGTAISRVGTAVVAMMAHTMKKPVMFCVETIKFSDKVLLDSICYNELGMSGACRALVCFQKKKRVYVSILLLCLMLLLYLHAQVAHLHLRLVYSCKYVCVCVYNCVLLLKLLLLLCFGLCTAFTAPQSSIFFCLFCSVSQAIRMIWWRLIVRWLMMMGLGDRIRARTWPRACRLPNHPSSCWICCMIWLQHITFPWLFPRWAKFLPRLSPWSSVNTGWTCKIYQRLYKAVQNFGLICP